MQNILKNITSFITKTVAVGVIGFGVYLLGQFENRAAVDELTQALAEERTTLSDFEVEIYLNAQALVGELGMRYQTEWDDMQSAVFKRVADPRWPATVSEVLRERRPNGEGCMVDAMCDAVIENLLSDAGQAARDYAAASLVQYQMGTFEPKHDGHSWATPAAADGHAYFEGLIEVVQGVGHTYFADAPTRPRARPGSQDGSGLLTSPRPVARPEQSTEDAVEAAVAIAMNE